ncbi:unnamed protein product [Linum tenue]|uniref:Uncharacterized protein n=1 Tax=Linum tenue TaxID=586396 RepID=A0AAV0LQ96_9ROSI|nr:unnamed protein product [Linum tenue]
MMMMSASRLNNSTFSRFLRPAAGAGRLRVPPITPSSPSPSYYYSSKYKMDKDTKETITKVKEAAETVKEGVNDVKKTTKIVRNIASSTADTVKKLAKDATDKVSNSAIQATTEIVKDKVKGKFD